jgi:hypothetical protein
VIAVSRAECHAIVNVNIQDKQGVIVDLSILGQISAIWPRVESVGRGASNGGCKTVIFKKSPT